MSSCLCAHHEGIRGVEVPILHILNLNTRWRCVVSFTLWLLSSPEKSHLYLLNWRLGVPQSYLGHFVQETYILPLLRIETWSVYSPGPSHYTNWPIPGAAGCHDVFVKWLLSYVLLCFLFITYSSRHAIDYHGWLSLLFFSSSVKMSN
jgi:hypothetical protein